MREICRDLLADMRDGDPWDLHARFAEPLPAMITTEIVGLPPPHWRQLQIWADDFAELIGNFRRLRGMLDEICAINAELLRRREALE